MSDDDPFYSPTLKPLPARVARPGELLFEFRPRVGPCVDVLRNAFPSRVVRLGGQFYERSELFVSRGAFVTKALAIQWAQQERAAFLGDGPS